MENIIKKAIEGGYVLPKRVPIGYFSNGKFKTAIGNVPSLTDFVCDLSFWQALGKACGWATDREIKTPRLGNNIKIMGAWIHNAEMFHRINITEGWDKAIKYLEKLTNKKSQDK